MNRHIDDAAALAAGHEPSDIRRFLNIGGRSMTSGRGFLQGPPQQWAEELTEVALTHGTSGFIVASDDTTLTRTFAAEVTPAVKELMVHRSCNRPTGVTGSGTTNCGRGAASCGCTPT
jgi:hypothetical protein